MSTPDLPSAEGDPRIPTLRAWYTAKDEAEHYNRNLMQYGTAVAAVLSILAGSGGIFAVANALKTESGSLPAWALMILWLVSIVGTIALVLLLGLLVHSFLHRSKAEKAVEESRGSLIDADLTPFLPTSQQPQ